MLKHGGGRPANRTSTELMVRLGALPIVLHTHLIKAEIDYFHAKLSKSLALHKGASSTDTLDYFELYITKLEIRQRVEHEKAQQFYKALQKLP